MSTRSMNWLKFGGLVALAFALGLLFAGLLDLPTRSQAQEQGRAGGSVITPVKAPAIPEARSLVELSDAFAAVANAVRPSVAYITATHTSRAPQRAQRMVPPGFERFFPRPDQQQPQFEQGSGSGFVVSADGYVLTNNHVVEGADKVTVMLADRRQFPAKVVGTDPNTDVAVLKIDARGLTPMALGNSDDVRIGEWVLAIGNPLGSDLTFTVTQGIVSAKGRSLQGLNRSNLNISDFIQTDAAINPGNSGGPLVNVRGEVIGINSAIASQTGFYSGYGFAVPINLAHEVMNQIIATGKVHRAALGIQIRDADVNDAAYVGLQEPTGVLVVNYADASSPAKKAGIEPGDVIVEVDGKPVGYTGQLQQRIAFRKPGETVQVTVARKGGVRKTYTVTLQAQADSTQVATADEAPSSGGSSRPAASAMGALGIKVQAVTPAIAQELGADASTKGLLVTDVTPGGPAFQSLIEPSNGAADVITSVEGTPVRTEADLRNVLKAQKPGAVVTVRTTRIFPDGTTQPQIVRLRLAGGQ